MRKNPKISHLLLVAALFTFGAFIVGYRQVTYFQDKIDFREASKDSISREVTGAASRLQSKNRYFAKKLENTSIRLKQGTGHRSDSSATPEQESQCKSLVYLTLQKLPSEHVESLKEVTLFYTKDGRRGLGGGGGIVLRCSNVSDAELAGVLVHEMGHIVDEGYLVSENQRSFTRFFDFGRRIFADDPSALFYNVSWYSHEQKLSTARNADFVSGYAMSDPFEDFAESYAYYVLHGEEFRTLAANNEALEKKYMIMKNSVFDGDEFGNYMPVERTLHKYSREYDVTVMPFEFRAFLGG